MAQPASDAGGVVDPVESLVRELRAHQEALEAQHADLRRAHQALRALHQQYVDLYEFAPVAYLTLAQNGLISQANLSGATLLGLGRRKLINRRLVNFIRPDDRDRFHRLCASVIEHDRRESCDLTLLRNGGPGILAHFDCVRLNQANVSKGMRVTLTDVSALKRADEVIEHQAFYDSLTSLPNRRLLHHRLQQVVTTQHSPRWGRAVLFLDLDDFKSLNDSEGHDVGDSLLRQVAERLLATVRAGDMVARLGGDEFVLILEGLSPEATEAAVQARMIGEKVIQALAVPFGVGGHEIFSGASIGMTLCGEQGETVDELLKRADIAMYRAKAEGRGTLRVFDSGMQSPVNERASAERDLRNGVIAGEFVLHYQARVDSVGRLIGAEALLRWAHPKRGLTPPGEFLPLAERTGAIVPLGDWVLAQSCAQLAAWAGSPATAHLQLGVNISLRQLTRRDFATSLLHVLEEAGTDPGKLVLEFADGLVDDFEPAVARMRELRAHGVRFGLDNFGAGPTSLTFLRHLPFDELNIGRAVVGGILEGSPDGAIASYVLALGQKLGLHVVAGGVETNAQQQFLVERGCSALQGFLFGEPAPVERFGAALV